MAAQNATFYCCKYSLSYIERSYTGGCSGNWEIEVNSASTSNGFGNFKDAFVLSRTCANLSSTPCLNSLIRIHIEMGCVPQSLYPITVNYTVKKNNVAVLTDSATLTLAGSNNCNNCEQRCGVFS